MRRNRACDPCAARKAKCDRESPCRRCSKLSISCVAVRSLRKSGPKGPWARRKREASAAAAAAAAAAEESSSWSGSNVGEPTTLPSSPLQIPSPPPRTTTSSTTSSNLLPISLFRRYLDIYHQSLYPVWPVVDRDGLLLRLQDPNDIEAYALAAAISAVTIAQLNLPLEGASALRVVDSSEMAVESERARQMMHYQENPSISVLLSSFFLHVASANRGQICKAALLLREAITFAQLLELDKGIHYLGLCKREAQLHLRIAWLLFITERGHTTRFEFSRILRLDPSLPDLEVDEKPSVLFAFISMCKLFQNFGLVMDSIGLGQTQDSYVAMHTRLRETGEFPQSSSDLQRADFLITQQWMRIVLWKMSMFHIKLMADPADESLSLCLPDHIARNIVSCLNTFPPHVVEAHGLGMEMKLFEVAISLADVLLCLPSIPAGPQLMQVGPRDILTHLVQYLTSFRRGDSVKLQILQQKMYDNNASSIPPIPELLETDEEQTT